MRVKCGSVEQRGRDQQPAAGRLQRTEVGPARHLLILAGSGGCTPAPAANVCRVARMLARSGRTRAGTCPRPRPRPAAPPSPARRAALAGLPSPVRGPARRRSSATACSRLSLAGAVLFNPERQAHAADVAAGFAVLLLPYSLIGPFAGVLLDRWWRQRVLRVDERAACASPWSAGRGRDRGRPARLAVLRQRARRGVDQPVLPVGAVGVAAARRRRRRAGHRQRAVDDARARWPPLPAAAAAIGAAGAARRRVDGAATP